MHHFLASTMSLKSEIVILNKDTIVPKVIVTITVIIHNHLCDSFDPAFFTGVSYSHAS